MTQQAGKHTHFGYKQVATEEKTPLVRGVFDAVASRYDVMNDLMSFGLHRWWKKQFLDTLAPKPGKHLLDVAGGTGDIADRFMQRVGKDSGSTATLCDINVNMLSEGRNRFIDHNRYHDIEFVCASAESLPFDDMAYDYYTIAFGIRNVTDIPAALKEAHRVLKPGGRFLCLEFSHMEHEFLQKIYDRYSFNVIPAIGKRVVGDAAPYQYLVESIRQFPKQSEFADMIREAGFSQVTWENLTDGVVAIHSGWRT